MKKAVSIFLVALLLLNVMGYYGFFLGLKYNNSIAVKQRLNADDYNESEAITLKILVSIPYYSDTEFERVDGEIEYNGEFYRLVKQKFEKDTLHIVCIRDLKSERIHQALTKYVKSFAEQSSDHPGSKTVPSFIKDYIPSSFGLRVSSAGWSAGITYQTVDERIFSAYSTSFSPPPEV